MKTLIAILVMPAITYAGIEITSSVRVESPLYVAWVNSEYHCCEQIDYTVRSGDISEVSDKPHAYWTPRTIRSSCLEASDYDRSGYDRGHLRALSLSTGNPAWNDVNCMAVIVPMNPQFNRITFRPVEETIAGMALKYGSVAVSIRCLFDSPMKPLSEADERHKIPSRFLITATSLEDGKQVGRVWLLDNKGTK